MKRYVKQSQGVTLLEVLLVLAIAAMIIVMSIRYYQSASESEQANMAMEDIQGITAAADNLALGTGSYATSVSTTAISNVIGTANMMSPTGGAITIGTPAATTYSVTIPLSSNVCASVSAKLAGNAKIASPACSSGTLTYTYTNTN